jgi:hypothetical protein
MWLTNSDLPPGPNFLSTENISLFMNMSSKNPFFKSVYNLTKKYGPIMTIRFGSKRLILISGHEEFVDAYQFTMNDAFMFRPHDIALNRAFNNKGTSVLLWIRS